MLAKSRTKFNKSSLRSLFLALLLPALLSPVISLGEPVGIGPLHFILAEVVDSLDKQGIDVLRAGGNASTTMRPRVAQLSGLSTPPPETLVQGWMAEFAAGAAGFVAAVKDESTGGRAVSSDKFLKDWAANPGKRVFLSFTSADLVNAEKVAEAFESKGYETFIYLNSGSAGPQYSPLIAGTMFREADYRFVLDTEEGRKSPGVIFEAYLNNLPRNLGNTAGPNPQQGPTGDGSVTAAFSASTFVWSMQNIWAVTKNPKQPNLIYVHKSESANSLIDPLYVIFVQSDGSWEVHGVDSRNRIVRRPIGTVNAPPSIKAGQCNCDFGMAR